MQEAVPAGEGAMIAILGMSIEEVEKEVEIFDEKSSHWSAHKSTELLVIGILIHRPTPSIHNHQLMFAIQKSCR